MSNFETIISKAIADAAFCKELLSNPKEVLQSNGVTATDEMLEALQGIDVNTLQKLAVAFSKEQVAS